MKKLFRLTQNGVDELKREHANLIILRAEMERQNKKTKDNVKINYKKSLGQALCNIPAPDNSQRSYADYFFDDFLNAAKKLGVTMEVVRSHEKYKSGFF